MTNQPMTSQRAAGTNQVERPKLAYTATITSKKLTPSAQNQRF